MSDSHDRIRIGMAALIPLGPSIDRLDEQCLRDAFTSEPGLERTEWTGAGGAFAVSQIPAAHEAVADGRPVRREIPTDGVHHALVFGQFFGGTGNLAPPEQRLLAFASGAAEEIQEINGSWAGIVWCRDGRLRCARDAPGIATLYASAVPGGALIATDLRVFFRSGLFGLDEQGLAEFLHYLYVPAPRTALAGVSAVLPGHVWDLSSPGRQTRFAPSRFSRGATDRVGDEEIARELPTFEQHLRRAVADSLPERGRIALAISGGKDSSALAIALSQLCPERVLAFNVGSDDPRADEASDAALVCRTLGLAFTSYTPTDGDLAEGLGDFVAVQEQPMGDPAALPYYLAMRRLPEDCRYIFDGTGNDYYFGVLNVSKGHNYDLRRRVSRFVPETLWPLVPRLMAYGPHWMRRLARDWRLPIEEAFVAWHGWSDADLQPLTGNDVAFDDTRLWQVMRESMTAGGEWLELLSEVIAQVWEPHTAYRKAVFFAEATGRQVRFPFADLRLSRYIRPLPQGMKVNAGRNKVLLRAYLARYLPSEILDKPKHAFVFDLGRVLRNPQYAWIDALDRRGLLGGIPGWRIEAGRAAAARYAASPARADTLEQLYALALLANVVASRLETRGERPELPETRTAGI